MTDPIIKTTVELVVIKFRKKNATGGKWKWVHHSGKAIYDMALATKFKHSNHTELLAKLAQLNPLEEFVAVKV